mmetsp:Transcript_12303/g.34871  ORF Transcript_12303/g.34871 Transcript_12303/m.34871 type:complete len:138 (-) Transcript_12303:129-542(-)
MGSACCSDSATLSREARQDAMLTAEEYKSGSTEDAVVLKMADANAVKTGKVDREEKARSDGEKHPLPPTESAAIPAAGVPDEKSVQADEEQVCQSDADPDLCGLELENLQLSATPIREREDGRLMAQGLTTKPGWRR